MNLIIYFIIDKLKKIGDMTKMTFIIDKLKKIGDMTKMTDKITS